ncbi:MAG: hypothetical protein JW727_03610 [Candidatus Aenigmarchaeota archaeon]|nr:hypothetical protein [Candidatus Aenigmarchaeota archaeon]
MEKQNIPKLRRDLALAMSEGKINETLRNLKNMPLPQLEALSEAEMKEGVDKTGLDEEQLERMEKGLEKLNFYVCGILMHRILDGE